MVGGESGDGGARLANDGSQQSAGVPHRPRLLVLNAIVAAPAAALAEHFELVDGYHAADLLALLSAEGAGIVAIATLGRDRCDRAVLSLLPDLRIICAIGAGVEGVDLAAANERGIIVTNGGSGNSDDVANHAIALWLAFRQELAQGAGWIAQDRWQAEGWIPLRNSLSVERVGVVGLGSIGQAIAGRLDAFGLPVGWWGPNAKPEVRWRRHDSLADLAGWATTLFIAARADESSRGLIDRAIIDALGPEGLVVNVARGFVIDEDAMIDALSAGRLGGAALDVFCEEPARPDRWTGVPNLVLTPHSASRTRQAVDTLNAMLVHNLRTVLTGDVPINVVN